jgi:hypothetical protein
MSLKLYVPLLHRGFGLQLSGLLEEKGLQPPRQNESVPQKPNSEQHGAVVGHKLVELHRVPPWAATKDSAARVRKARVVVVNIVSCGKGGPKNGCDMGNDSSER